MRPPAAATERRRGYSRRALVDGMWPLIDRKRTRGKMDDNEVRLRKLWDLSVDMLCIAGLDGYLKSLNPAWMDNLGYTRDELLSRPYLDFVHPDDLADTSS